MKSQFSKPVCWLAVPPIASLLFSGCAGGLPFGPADTQIGVIPSGPITNAVVRSVIPYYGHYIRFQSAEPWPEGNVTITLTNTSAKKAIPFSVPGEGTFYVQPNMGVLLYDGSLSNLLAGKKFRIHNSSGRTACELDVRFAPATELTAPIRIMCWCDAPSF